MRSVSRPLLARLAGLVLLVAALPAGAWAAAPLRFAVSVSGAARWATTYHSTAPNPGGAPDHNSAHDASTQRWNLRFAGRLAVPVCGAVHRRDPCSSVRSLSGAGGGDQATGTIDHLHVDGLYSQLNAGIRCTVRAGGAAGQTVPARLSVAYVARAHRFVLTLRDTAWTALLLLPTACPGQGDSIDGLYDNYFTPGFSFAPGWGSARWFTSAPVSLPVATVRRHRRIALRFGPARRNTPPAGCAVMHRAWEQCHTAGAWSAVVTLSRL